MAGVSATLAERGLVASLCLPFGAGIASTAELDELLVKMLAHDQILRRNGLSPEYVRVQMLLIAAQERAGRAEAAQALETLALEVSCIDDLGLRARCLGVQVESLSDSVFVRDEILQRKVFVGHEFEKCMAGLLSATAMHEDLVLPVVETLMPRALSVALDLASRCNTVNRRDVCLLTIVSGLAAERPGQPALVLDVANRMRDRVRADESLAAALRGAWETHAGGPVQEWIGLLRRLELTPNLVRRARCCLWGMGLLGEIDVPDALAVEVAAFREHLLGVALETLDRLPVGWRLSRLVLLAMSVVGHESRDRAREVQARFEQKNAAVAIPTNEGEQVLCWCLSLAIEAFGGLLQTRYGGKRSEFTPEDAERLERLFALVVTPGRRVGLWCDFALAYHSARRMDEFSRVVETRLEPILADLKRDDPEEYWKGAVYSGPALFLARPLRFLEVVGGLPFPFRDMISEATSRYMFRRVRPSMPFVGNFVHVFDGLSYDDALDCVGLLSGVADDEIAFGALSNLVDAICGAKGASRLTKEQRADVAGRLEVAAKKGFPSQEFISHNGYLIASYAYIARLRENTDDAFWRGLEARARKEVSNVADLAYVLAILAQNVPSKVAGLRASLCEGVLEVGGQIPDALERANRFSSLAAYLSDSDRGFARRAMAAAKVAFEAADPAAASRSLPWALEVAHRIDPALAEEIAEGLGEDAGRLRARAIDKSLRLIKQQRDLVEGNGGVVGESRRELAHAAWRALGVLNAGRATPHGPEKMRELVAAAASAPLSEVFPVYSLVVANLVKKFALTDACATVVRPMFVGLTDTASLLAAEVTRTRPAGTVILNWPKVPSGGGIVVGSGEREKAIAWIVEWLKQNAGTSLKICDPYLGLGDLEILKIVREVVPGCHVRILTSKQHQKGVEKPHEESYRSAWSRICAQEPPRCEIVIVGARNGESTIHDRWWLAGGRGFRMGTSFQSLGGEKETDLSVMSPEEVREHEESVDRYLGRVAQEASGTRLEYSSFTL